MRILEDSHCNGCSAHHCCIPASTNAAIQATTDQPPPLRRVSRRTCSEESRERAPAAQAARASGTMLSLPRYTSKSARHSIGDSTRSEGLACIPKNQILSMHANMLCRLQHLLYRLLAASGCPQQMRSLYGQLDEDASLLPLPGATTNFSTSGENRPCCKA